MTIVTAHKADKKLIEGGKQPHAADDFLLAKTPTEKDGAITLVIETNPKLRRTISNVCIPLAGVLLFLTMVVGGVYLYKLATHRTVRGFCKVPYYYEELSYINDFSESDSNVYHNFGGNHYGADKRTRHSGVFEELMELDIIDNSFEKFDVPAFEDVMGASVVHDFHKNLSAIVDELNTECFIMELNRTLVQPPKDFWDLLNKLGDGYYFPDTEIIMKNYEPMFPPVQDVSQLGFHIWSSCRRFNTYLLKEVEPNGPVAMVKRDVSHADRRYAIAPAKLIQKVHIHFHQY